MRMPSPQSDPPVLQPVTTVPEAVYQANRRQLIHVLQMAYSGEKSAALAYQSHAASRVKPDERAMIQRIEQ